MKGPGQWVVGAFPFCPTACTIDDMQPITLLDRLLATYPSAKRQTLKRMVEAGRVRVNGHRAARLKQVVAAHDQVEVADRPAQPAPKPAHVPDSRSLDVVYEDDDLLVVNKPPGLLTSTVPRERRPTLLALVREQVARKQPRAVVGLIHRLDRDASGLLVFSKNDPSYRALKTQFFHHTVGREYRAVVHGIPQPPAGRVETRLVERADGTVRSTRQAGKGQVAVTAYEVLKTQGKLSLVRVTLHTGRKHQIRVQMAGLGNPVVGDALYGPDKKADRLMLAAISLSLLHPRTGKQLRFAIPTPDDFPVRDDAAPAPT
jgi:23S rRNA pseudouridine1911/1915/1917 synthase